MQSVPAYRSGAARDVMEANSTNKRMLFGLLAAYFVLQLFLRLAVSDSAELDESEQLILTQRLSLGYGSQPPLYTWLQAGFFALFGTNLFALMLFKNLLLFGTFLLVYLAAKETALAAEPALVAATSLFLIPPIAWESQRDLTHTVLATLCAAATLLCFLKVIKTRQPLFYGLMGLCAGLGLIAKYNFALLLAALLLSTLLEKDFRSALRNRWILLSLACFLAVLLPHAVWMWAHQEAVLTQSQKLHVRAASLGGAYARGVVSLITAVGGFAGLLAAVFTAMFARAPQVSDPPPEAKKLNCWLGRALMIGLLICVALIFLFKARFKGRWMQPLLFAAPIYLTCLVQSRLDRRRCKRMVFLNGFAALVFLIALPAAPLLASVTGKFSRRNAPYSALASQIKEQNLVREVIVAEDRLVGGNLKLFFTHSVVIVPELAQVPVSRETAWLVVWDATEGDELPRPLVRLVEKLRGSAFPEASPRFVEATLLYSKQQRLGLGLAVIEPLAKTEAVPLSLLTNAPSLRR